jgi:SOS response regulatory protein OraA/RecX
LQETWDEQTQAYEFEQVKHIFQKKYHGIIPEEPAEKNKMLQFFMRKGYTMSTVQEVLDEMSLGNLHNYN